jgi:RimJ/RimL family protein N-acetyltransferase
MVNVVPARVEWLEALVEGDDVFTDRFGTAVVEGWVGFPEALPVTLEAMRREPDNEWGTHLFFDELDGALVGIGGWKGRPQEGEVELGYAVAPARQGRGIATAVVQELVGRAQRAGVAVVTAHTLPEPNASNAVLRKCGFGRGPDVVEEGVTVWRWELPLVPAPTGTVDGVPSLSTVAPAFVEMAHRIVWCVAATTGKGDRARTRVLHPMWEWDGETLTGWILTSPRSPKSADLARVPALSLTYWAPDHDTCTADCDAEFRNEPADRQAGWDRFAGVAPPLGYEPSIIPAWPSPDAPDFGVLRLTPRRLRVMPGTVMTAGTGEVLTWSADA